jgi:hypothetical protein
LSFIVFIWYCSLFDIIEPFLNSWDESHVVIVSYWIWGTWIMLKVFACMLARDIRFLFLCLLCFCFTLVSEWWYPPNYVLSSHELFRIVG